MCYETLVGRALGYHESSESDVSNVLGSLRYKRLCKFVFRTYGEGGMTEAGLLFSCAVARHRAARSRTTLSEPTWSSLRGGIGL